MNAQRTRQKAENWLLGWESIDSLDELIEIKDFYNVKLSYTVARNFFYSNNPDHCSCCGAYNRTFAFLDNLRRAIIKYYMKEDEQ